MRRLGVLVTGILLMLAGPTFAQDESRSEFSGGWRHYHMTLHSVLPTVGFRQQLNDWSEG